MSVLFTKEQILEGLNHEQEQAVTTFGSPLMVLASAGAGKTSILTRKIVYLHRILNTDINRICAITFTNKASQEMKERISKYLGMKGRLDYVSTFHSLAVKILKESNITFNIYDSNDSESLIKHLLVKFVDENRLNSDIYATNIMKSAISNVKLSTDFNEGFNKFEKNGKAFRNNLEEFFNIYQQELKNHEAMDFDDLIVNAVNLLKENQEIKTIWQNKFDYFLVDEYQDTNGIQYEMLKYLVSEKNQSNIMIVGDMFQSIYGFRGSNPENMLSFENDYKNTKIIRLEKNYRSTTKIIEFANNILKKSNVSWKDKILEIQSTKTIGHDVSTISYSTDDAESLGIAQTIMTIKTKQEKIKYSDFAILVRNSFLTQSIEMQLRRNRVPYKIYGGLSFYDRKEIKLLLSICKFILNKKDKISLLALLNMCEGLGKKGIETIEKQHKKNTEWIETLNKAKDILMSKARESVTNLISVLENIPEDINTRSFTVMSYLINNLKINSWLDNQSKTKEELESRKENVTEFLNVLSNLQAKKITLETFLQEIVLGSNDDEKDENKVKIMTIHASKGLEFPIVFIPACEEDIMPSKKALTTAEIEEERRMFYVAVTRAKFLCYISHAKYRGFNKQNNISKNKSRFLLN